MSSSTAPDPASAGAGHRIAVVGAGVMGAGIAQVLAVAGSAVVLVDVSEQVLERARGEIRSGRFGLDSAVARGKLDTGAAERAFRRISYCTDLAAAADVASVSLAVEAVPEQLALKIGVFRRLDELLAPEAVLASNSSGFPIAALAAATNRADKVVGWHWASPAPVMKLAEIVRTPTTSQATIALVTAIAGAAGKNPLVINDAPMSWGYVANRIYAAAHREAVRVVEDGVATREQVDQALVDCFRWPTGPFGMSAGASSGWSG